ncbi:hypothetical protein H696_00153 [Fonticula alba]|uniref:Uncharacterized protein n=1 Tax=Fonticula alba TaxID=691883 RepID=A0A058ZGE9_FONAL|nr:hypothetical protein H696_00153 [Fonticula alba]KCV72562.1 hypothetical protein H696_00153 [Fonticula alba]|eukprot:XP_009492263.1 hypothetical protein H696_00153 [Fonticula alba]
MTTSQTSVSTPGAGLAAGTTSMPPASSGASPSMPAQQPPSQAQVVSRPGGASFPPGLAAAAVVPVTHKGFHRSHSSRFYSNNESNPVKLEPLPLFHTLRTGLKPRSPSTHGSFSSASIRRR